MFLRINHHFAHAHGLVAAFLIQPKWPYPYGRMVCMKKTLNIDAKLLSDAKTACGANTDTETVRLGLQALVRRAAYQRSRAYMELDALEYEVPRRREKPAPKRATKRKAA